MSDTFQQIEADTATAARHVKRFASWHSNGFFRPMPNTAELVKMPVADRLALIDELLASVSEDDISLEATQVNETCARWSELKANPALGLSYAELKARLG